MAEHAGRNPRKSYAGDRKSSQRGLTSPTDSGLTSRATSETGSLSAGAPVRPSFGVLRERRGTNARPGNVIDDLAACIQPAKKTRCLAPNCDQKCEWPSSGGRPGRFCSRGCQERFDRDRGRLQEEVAAIHEALDAQPDRTDRLYLEKQLSRRVWLLERYPLPYKEQARLQARDVTERSDG